MKNSKQSQISRLAQLTSAIEKLLGKKCSECISNKVYGGFPVKPTLLLLLLFWSMGMLVVPAQNAIVTENAKTGNPSSEWQITGAGDLSIQGFATDMSYNKGETARFKIKTNARAYTIKIYRLGYYQGNGARFHGNATITASLPQTQPNCITDSTTGLLDCGNWNQSATWVIPATAVSGIYIAKLTRTDTGGSSHIVFIVRDDAGNSDLLFQTSDATWQAYNIYGDNNNGKSLYTGTGGKAFKVSYNRPFLTRDGGGGGGPSEDWLFNAEYPMLRWIEANGYDVSYTTNVDSDRRGELIKNHKVFLSVGHDEYWSGPHRAKVVEARNAGTHLAFFSGNEVYWKTRWETSIDGTGTAHRTLVCYKEGSLGENTCSGKCDPSPEWTGLWRSGCEYTTGDPLADGCNPENVLTGQISWELSDASLQVPGTFRDFRFWRNTGVASLGENQTASFTFGTIGYEWNAEQELYRPFYPNGRILLSRTVINGKTHNISLYKHQSGALVFGAGTVQWSWGLDRNHDRGNAAPSLDMQQATLNLFADMGVQPGSKQSDLVAAIASTDFESPVTTISNPEAGDILPQNVATTISGTAADNQVLAGVEISVDQGLTWNLATGTTNWTYTWTPTGKGAITVLSRAFDDSGNIGAPATVNVQIGDVVVNCPCSVFNAEYPVSNLENDGQPLQLGMKFNSTVDGFITGVRFYKQSGTTGQHTGQLYTSTGNLLAEVIFTNETVSGWQQAFFNTPVAIAANTTYIISYHSSAGFYSVNDHGFDQPISNGPLRGLANGEDGPNGLYLYTATPAFPNSNYLSSNYYVDVIFDTATEEENSAPTVAISSPENNTAFVAPASVNITAVASDSDGTIAKVEFYNGATKLGEDLSSPYEYLWENISEGNYTLTAVATDDIGASTTSTAVQISVSAPSNEAPTVAISSPENNAAFVAQASVNITAVASDADGTIAKVEFYNGTTKLGEDLSSPYEFLWENISEGNYTLTAVATDDKGASATSTAVQISVSAPSNEAPTVAISSPENNAVFVAPASVNINAVASDADGTIEKVEFYNGATKLGEDLSSPYEYLWESISEGNYTITAVATDDKGASTTSTAVQILVSAPSNEAPAVAIISPENNAAFIAPASVNINAVASDTDGTIAKVEFYNDATKLGEDLSSPYEYLWENISEGNYTLTAVATDDRGASATSGIVNITVSNPSPPTISAVNPTSGPAGTLVVITGNNLSYATKVTFGPASATIITNTDTRLEVLVPSVKGKLPSSVNLTVTTPYGSVTATNKFIITSGTAPSNTAPLVSITSPENNSTFAEPADIIITAAASDSDGSISKVEFFNGNILLAEDFTSPYTYNWSNVLAGNYTLTARATDDKGAQTTSAPINVSVISSSNIAPSVSIATPLNNANFVAPANITIVASASDPDGTVTIVEFFNGNLKLGEDLSGPYEFNWNNVPSGSYVLTAKATDNFGAMTTSEEINIVVLSGTSISAPSNLIAAWVSNSQVNLSWQDNSDNETGFILERATKSDFSGKIDIINLTANATNYQDGNLNSKKGGGILYYRIKAVNGSLTSEYSNSVLASPLTASTKIAETNSQEIKIDVHTEEDKYLFKGDLIIYPNPTTGTATIDFALQEAGSYTVSLFNIQGAFITNLGEGTSEAGVKISINFDGNQLANGLYLIKLSHTKGNKTYRLILAR